MGLCNSCNQNNNENHPRQVMSTHPLASLDVSQKKKHFSNFSAIIIGAGISGLSAASSLKKAGFSVKILEARNQYGGRIRPLKGFADFAIELGGEEIHGENSKYKQQIEKQGIEIQDQDELVHYVQCDNKIISYEQMEKLHTREYDFLDTMVEECYKKDTVISVEQYIKKQFFDEKFLHYYDLLTAREFGTSLDKLNAKLTAKCFNKWQAGEKNFFIKNEVTHLDVLKKIFINVLDSIVLNCPVKSIIYKDKSSLSKNELIQVKGNKQKFTANVVVVTIPINQLQKNKIKFDPPLPENQIQAINKIEMGGGGKIIMKFLKQFWPENSCNMALKGICSYWWNVSQSKNQKNNFVISGLISGQKNVELLQNKTQKEIGKIFLDELQQAFQNINLEEILIDSYYFDWSQEKYIEGLYSYPGLNEEEDTRLIAGKSIENQIFFAGEAFHQTDYQSIHGAYESGIKTAEEILEIFLKAK